jgi:hypothetical protein
LVTSEYKICFHFVFRGYQRFIFSPYNVSDVNVKDVLKILFYLTFTDAVYTSCGGTSKDQQSGAQPSGEQCIESTGLQPAVTLGKHNDDDGKATSSQFEDQASEAVGTFCNTCKMFIKGYRSNFEKHLLSQRHAGASGQKKEKVVIYCSLCRTSVNIQTFERHKMTKSHKKQESYFKTKQLYHKGPAVRRSIDRQQKSIYNGDGISIEAI